MFFFPSHWCSAATDKFQHHGVLLSWPSIATMRWLLLLTFTEQWVRPRPCGPVNTNFSTQVVTASLCSAVVLCNVDILTWAVSPPRSTRAVLLRLIFLFCPSSYCAEILGHHYICCLSNAARIINTHFWLLSVHKGCSWSRFLRLEGSTWHMMNVTAI